MHEILRQLWLLGHVTGTTYTIKFALRKRQPRDKPTIDYPPNVAARNVNIAELPVGMAFVKTSPEFSNINL